jgi:hypothetical protein
LKKQIKRKRNLVHSAPPAPLDLLSLEILQTYLHEERFQEQFFLVDSGKEIHRILTFGRLSALNILQRSKTWFVDDTFNIRPSLFAQVYIILAEDLGGMHPVIYALLPNKKSETYSKFLKMLKNLNPELSPCSI